MSRRTSGGTFDHARSVEPKAEQDQSMMDEALLDSMEEELRDFLAADLLHVRVDPAFKERLRRELWELVSANAEKLRAELGRRSEDDDAES